MQTTRKHRRIFLTGHRGYLGQCLAHLIQEDPDLSLVTSEVRLEDIPAQSIDCEGVIHGATRREPAADAAALTGLLNALKAPVPFIFTSSVKVYGNHQHQATEQIHPEPDSPYGQSKYQLERRLQNTEHPLSILRLGSLWGYGVNRYGKTFLDQALQRIAQHESLSLLSPPVYRNHLFVWDAARWIHHMVQDKLQIPVLNMAGETQHFQTQIEDLCRHAPAGYHPTLHYPESPAAQPSLLMSTALWEHLRSHPLTPWPELVKYAFESGVFAHEN